MRALVLRHCGKTPNKSVLRLIGYQSWEQATIAIYRLANAPNLLDDARYCKKTLQVIDANTPIEERFRIKNLVWKDFIRERELPHKREMRGEREEIERIEGMVRVLRSTYPNTRYLDARKIHALARKCLNNQAINRPIVELVSNIMAKYGYRYELKGRSRRYIKLDP